MILRNIVLAPGVMKACQGLCTHSNNNCHRVSHFPYKCIVESDMSPCINTLLDCFPERTVTLDIESTITCMSVHYVVVAALFTGLTIKMTSPLCVLRTFIMNDCVNCLLWCFTASKHLIAPLNIVNDGKS